MTNAPLDAVTIDQLAAAAWRKSSFSGDQGACVETALLADGRIAVRNSNAPESDVVFFTRAEMDAWVKGCKAGEFDDVM
ncbi:MAG: DUF397 domain-containing protein [Pseudonocardiaceae bacterium]